MFHLARLKLTLYYLIITTLISGVFSLAIFASTDRQFARFFELAKDQSRSRQTTEFNPHLPPPPPLTRADIQSARRQLLINLITINLVIMVLAGGAGYFLSGQALKPIKEMLDEQARFVSDASHELKTPITALRSQIEVYFLDKKHTQHAADTLLKSCLDETKNLQSLTENLLLLTKYEVAGKHTFRAVSLLQCFEDALKQILPLARLKQITIKHTFKDAQLYADGHSISELFIIILDNAIKYSQPNTQISISSKLLEHAVQIDIKDQGIGIDPKDIPHLFDRFYRADVSRTKQKSAGFGLGLSIAEKITKNHNGTIDVVSVPQKGSIFSITLPLAKNLPVQS